MSEALSKPKTWTRGLKTTRFYVFFAMLVVVLIPLGVKYQNRESAAFERELVKVEQGHLIIAQNLSSTLDRYARDATGAFDFVVANQDVPMDMAALNTMLEPYCILFVAEIGADNQIARAIYDRDRQIPPADVIADFRRMASEGKTSISPIVRVDEQPLMYFIRRGAEGQLYIGAFDMKFLVRQQKEIAFGERGHAMLVDHTGRVIAHPKEEWTKSSKDASPLPVVQRMIAGDTGVMQFFSPPLQADMIAGYTSVPFTGWGAMVPQPVQELRDAARVEADELLRLFAVLAVVTIVASWILSGLITRPLEQIAATVGRVRRGDMGARVARIAAYSPSEMTSLRNVLNGLLDSVDENRAMLEQSLEAAEQANASKGQAISVLSHEMRTPLNGIIGALDMMSRTKLDDTQSKYSEIIGTSARTLLDHVNDVLEVSRLDGSTVSVDLSTEDIGALLQDIIDENTAIASQKDIRLKLQLDAGLPRHLDMDRRKLRKIVANLVGNAVKFTEAGQITVQAGLLPGDKLDIRVRDTGAGIAQEDLERIFEPFAVVDSDYSRTHEGSGLGLSIVAMTAKALGGEVSVESQPGHGSEFRVQVPVIVARATAATKVEPGPDLANTSGSSKTVLVVDDNEINRVVLGDMVRTLGHTAVMAKSGPEALKHVDEQSFELILMDISMPGLDGTETAQRIRDGNGPNATTRIVAQTAHARPEDHDRFAEAGMQGVLTKPVTLAGLANCLDATAASAIAGDAEQKLLIDADQFRVLISAAGQAKAHEMVVGMLTEADQVLDGLANGTTWEDGRQPSIAKVHNMAGACATLGANRLFTQFQEIESRLKDEARAGFDELLKQTRQALEQTRNACDKAGLSV